MSDEYDYLYTDPNAPTKPYTGDDPYVLARLQSGSGISWLDKLSVNTGIKAPNPPKISNILPTVGDIDKAFNDATNKISSIIGVSVADVSSLTNKVTTEIKTLSNNQVSGMIAQVSKDVPQSATSISNDLGLGKFGLSTEQLEKGGYLKPGVVNNFVGSAGKTTTEILNNSAVWTGKDGVKDVQKLLNNETLQNNVQVNLWKNEYDDLLVKGAISGNEDPAKLGGMLTAASKFGTETTLDWVKGKLPGNVKSEFDKIAKSSQMAINLVDQKVPVQAKNSLVPPLAKNTTNRAAVDQALSALIGNSKIATPKFAPPSIESVLSTDDGFSALVNTATTPRGSNQDNVTGYESSVVTVTNPPADVVSIPSSASKTISSSGGAVNRKRDAAQACGCSENELIAIGSGFAGPIWACPNGKVPPGGPMQSNWGTLIPH